MVIGKRRKKNASPQPPHIDRELIVSRMDKTVVSDGGEVKPPSSVGRMTRRLKQFWARRRLRMAFLLVLGILLLGGGALAYIALRPEKPVARVPSCSGDLLVRARENLSPAKHEELKKITDEIKQVPGYEQDATCLVILLTFEINGSNPRNAREYLTRLEKAYNTKEGYDNAIARHVKKPEEYRSSVESLEKQAADYPATQKNRYIPPEAPGSTP